MTTYYFVRHGESTANQQGLFAGFIDVALTEKGITQARGAAKGVAEGDIWFDAIIASPLSRAFETAKIIAAAIHFPSEKIILLPELRERSAGELELATVTDVYEVSEEQMAIYGGETAAAFQHRVSDAFADIHTRTAGMQNVLIVAHAGVYKMAVALTEGIEPATKAYQIPPPPNATLLPFPI